MSLGGECKDVVLKFYDSWNRGEIDFDELVDEGIVNHQPDVEPERGRDPFRDRVAIRISWSGTYLGAQFRGWRIPAPAKFAVEHMHIYRVASGKLAEHWVVRDDLAMLRQLGVTSR
jgi:hypothetical protein